MLLVDYNINHPGSSGYLMQFAVNQGADYGYQAFFISG